MIDKYDREERIAIRMCSGMTEIEAVKLTDADIIKQELSARVSNLAGKVPHHKHSTVRAVDPKKLASGDNQ